MRPTQFLLFYAWGVLGFTALLGAPPEPLAWASFIGAWVSVLGLVVELLDG